MNHPARSLCALILATTAWPTMAADFYWNCTTPAGIEYADANKCDKGDAGVKVMRGEPPACKPMPAYCASFDYGVIESTARAQAIEQFMRRKECAFLARSPATCVAQDRTTQPTLPK